MSNKKIQTLLSHPTGSLCTSNAGLFMPKETYRTQNSVALSSAEEGTGRGSGGSWLPLCSWGQACGQPGKTDMNPPASGGANHQEQHSCCLQATYSRCEHFIFPLGVATLSPVSVAAFGCTTSLLFSPEPPSSLLYGDIALGKRS